MHEKAAVGEYSDGDGDIVGTTAITSYATARTNDAENSDGLGGEIVRM